MSSCPIHKQAKSLLAEVVSSSWSSHLIAGIADADKKE